MEISNNRLIIGGSFTNISGTSVKNIAIYSLPSLQLVSLTTVQDESVSSGISIYSNYLYYMGLAPHVPFQYISRYDLNLLEPDTLFRIPADGTSFGSINSMLADNDYVYVAGDLNDPGGINNLEGICRFNIASKQIDTTWQPNTINALSPWGYEIGKYNNHIYLGGSFSTFGGLSRKGIVEIDLNGNVTNKNFYLSNSQVYAIKFQGNTIWIGSNSANIGGAFHPRVSQVDISNGFSTCWYPPLTGQIQISPLLAVDAIEVDQDTVFLGGRMVGPTANTRYLSMFTGNPSYINIGPDLQLCPPVPFTLNAAQGNFTSFLWNTGASTPTITSTQPGLYWVTALDANGCYAIDSVQVDFCTNMPGLIHQNFVQFIYADKKELALEIPFTAPDVETTFQIYTMEGRVLKMGNLRDGRNIVSLPDHASALVLCKVIQAGNSAVFRFFSGQ